MKTNNQQERLKTIYWILGFTDGEGCFTVSFINNPTTKFGKQIFPEFVITQSEKSFSTLKNIKKFFKCGDLILNKRYDNHHEHLYKYCVRSILDLNDIIIPFFEKNNLRTSKKKDFIIFSRIIKMMINKKHFRKDGFDRILKLAEKMNRKKKRL